MHAIPAHRHFPSTGIASKLAPTPEPSPRQAGPCVRTFRRSVLARDPCASPLPKLRNRERARSYTRTVSVVGSDLASGPSVVGACLHAIPARRRFPSSGIASKLAPTPDPSAIPLQLRPAACSAHQKKKAFPAGNALEDKKRGCSAAGDLAAPGGETKKSYRAEQTVGRGLGNGIRNSISNGAAHYQIVEIDPRSVGYVIDDQ